MKDFLYTKGFNLVAASSLRNLPSPLRDQLLELNPLLIDKSLLLIGSGGRHLWNHLTKNNETHQDIKNLSLDHYALEMIDELSSHFHLHVSETLYPNHPTIYPLGQLIKALFHTHTALCGPEISPDYGMWFGIRLLLVIDEEIEIPQELGTNSTKSWHNPCLSCEESPCLEAILKNKDMRAACPFKKEQQYEKGQLDHHNKYLKNLRP